MKQIEVHNYIKNENMKKVIEFYIYKPDDPKDNEILEELGWKRKNLFDNAYFYHTRDTDRAKKTSDRLDISIVIPEEQLIWKM